MATTAKKKNTGITAKKVEDTATKAVNTIKASPNTVLILGGLIVGGYFLSKLGSGISKVGNALGDATENVVDAQQPENDKTKPGATLNQAQAAQIAETLYAAMAQAGTDEQRIFDALRGVLYNDWVLIKNAFGQRRYNSITGEGSFAPFPLANLAEWINQELSGNDLKKLAQIAPEVFKGK